MSTPADYFQTLTIADFVAQAFEQKVGGIFSGVGTQHAVADQAARRQAKAAGQVSPESYARARLVPVAPGKVMVRWCSSAAMSSFESAAGGLWWSSDDIADRIVRETVRKLGPNGDSGKIARVVSAVHHGWSDLGGVVVARTTLPVKVMVGFGRPVTTVLPDTGQSALLGEGKDLQFMLLTSPNRVFRGREFLQCLYLGTSTAFTTWWTANNPAAQRRAATIQAARDGNPTVGGGYPTGVVRTS
jgi:hypothetical protein